MIDISKQDEEWIGKFGDSYTRRNFQYVDDMNKIYMDRYGVTRRDINKEFLEDVPLYGRILEVGCNIGTQLIMLREMGYKNLYGIDINSRSLEIGRSRDNTLNIIEGNAQHIPFKDEYFDMVFTSGLLIHISPGCLNKVVDEICRVTNGYIFGLEYYADEMKEINYRGNDNMLWKGNYPELYDKYSHRSIKIEKEKLLDYKDGSGNRDIVFLLKKLKCDA